MAIVGKYKLDKKLNNLLDLDIDNKIMKACVIVEAKAKSKCPAHTGELRNSITSEVLNGEGRVGTNLEYAPYIHQGTGIYAVNGDGRKTPWGWYDPTGDYTADGEPGIVFTYGQQPNPFLEDAFNESKAEIDKIFQDGIKEAVKK